VSVAATAFRNAAYCVLVTSYFPIWNESETAPHGASWLAPQSRGSDPGSAACPGAATVTQPGNTSLIGTALALLAKPRCSAMPNESSIVRSSEAWS